MRNVDFEVRLQEGARRVQTQGDGQDDDAGPPDGGPVEYWLRFHDRALTGWRNT